MTRQARGKKAYIGLSGGVDSSVSAALLKAQGYDVTGVFIKVWTPPFLECSWKDDRLDAMRVCAQIGIPFQTLDLEAEYKRDVVDYMVREYSAGRTPNPDVMCNKHIKFGAFYDWARKNGADIVATGHYAEIESVNGTPALRVADDRDKDQSYFLWSITNQQLPHLAFPIGGLPKPEVRALARKFGLITADKKDSQGLCFLGKIDMKDFLKEFIDSKPGNVLGERGAVIGSHEGALFYTIGERRGFSISQKRPDGEALYVVGKDMQKNTITVSARPRAAAAPKSLQITLNAQNWLQPPEIGEQFECRFRYRQPLRAATLASRDGAAAIVDLSIGGESALPAIGQSLVAYRNGVLLGGGIIERVVVLN